VKAAYSEEGRPDEERKLEGKIVNDVKAVIR
jgi:hypothetical protein